MTTPDLPTPTTSTSRRLTWVWLVPLLALVVAGVAIWRNYQDQGPLITVTFPTAAGIKKETPLKFRDVEVGMVEDVSFSDDLTAVDVHIRVSNKIVPYLDAEAEFWVIQPELSTRGVTGLETVLSGVYIEGSWDSNQGEPQRKFFGNESAPLARPSEEGTTVVLRARTGNQLTAGAPVLYQGIEVGRIGQPRLEGTDNLVTIEAFIAAPHDKRMTTNSRFWDNSGFSVSLGTSGVSLDVGSLASLVEGGISFGTLVSGGGPVRNGHVFDIFEDEASARSHIFSAPSGQNFGLAVLLDNDISGLVQGSPVRYQGVKVGEVTDMTGFVMPPDGGRRANDVRLLVNLSVTPSRLGITGTQSTEEVLNVLQTRVENGLRARLASEGLFSQTLIIDLFEDTTAPAEDVRTDLTTLPIIPSVAANIQDGTASVQGIVERVDGLPIEELMGSAIETFDSINRLVSNADTQGIPGEAIGLLTDARGLVTSASLQESLAQVEQATTALNDLATRINDSEGLASLLVALEQSETIATGLSQTSEALPGIAAQISDLTTTLNALPLSDVATRASVALERVDTLLAAPEMAELAPGAAQTLADLQATLDEFRESGVIDSLNTTLTEAEILAKTLSTSAESLPSIMDDVSAVVASAKAVPLNDLSTSISGLIARVDSLLRAPGTDDIPAALAGALTELRASLTELREGGAVENVNRTLGAARSAMASIETASAGLPGLVTRMNALSASLTGLVETYGDRSRFNTDLDAALREITQAAEAVEALARYFERNPDAIIRGR